MATNPYMRNLSPGTFQIDYLGQEQGFYVLCVRLTGHLSMDAHMFNVQLTEWLMDSCTGKHFMGRKMNGLCGTPSLKSPIAPANDHYLLLDSIVDLIMFERDFPVSGITPAKLAI
jgi:hypothetical protein